MNLNIRNSLIIFGILCAAALHGKRHETVIEQLLPVEELSSISVENTNGSIRVSGADTDEIKIVYKKIVETRHEEIVEETMDAIEVEITKDGDHLKIDTKTPNSGSNWWKQLFNKKANIQVKYDIIVPNAFEVELESVNGGIQVSDVANEIEISSVNGGIQVKGSGGPLDIETVNGGITVQIAEMPSEKSSIDTVNGGIKLQIPSSGSAEFEVQTVNGGINYSPQENFNIEVKKRRHLKASVGEEGPKIKIGTVNGGVRITQT